MIVYPREMSEHHQKRSTPKQVTVPATTAPATTADQNIKDARHDIRQDVTATRFPRYGTSEFARQCNWTMYPSVERDCELMFRPKDQEHEGLADWVTKAVADYISSKLKGGCKFLMDYGQDVDVQQVLVPHAGSPHNWTVPTGFNCVPPKCSKTLSYSMIKRHTPSDHTMVPNYRHAFKKDVSKFSSIYRKNFQHLEQALPGFDLGTGLACGFESLVELSPSASQFQPNLFTHILPTLRDDRNLVLALYFRSGRTDRAAQAEKSGNSTPAENMKQIRMSGKRVVTCILAKEKQLLSESSAYSRVVWLVVSDSPYFKRWTSETYTSPNANQEDAQSAVLPREIVTTTSRGMHTRTARNPSTTDFAEAMIDWYLIGESDIVLVNGREFTYGTTAAMRTNRPLYDVGSKKCSQMRSFIREEEPPTLGGVQAQRLSKNVVEPADANRRFPDPKQS